MKRIPIISFFTLTCCIVSSAWSAAPFTIAVDGAAIPSTFSVGSSGNYYYKVTNNSGVITPITISGVTAPVTIGATPGGTAPSLCGPSLAAGASCDINLLIAPTITQRNQTFNQTLQVLYGGKKPLAAVLPSFTVSSALSTLIAVGQSYEGVLTAQPPLIAAGTVISSTVIDWVLPVLPITITSAILNAASCSDTFCIAGGQKADTVGSGGEPTGSAFMLQSTDGGVTWAPTTLGGSFSVAGNQAINAINCTHSGSANNILCLAGGQDNTSATNLFLTYNTNTASSTAWNTTGLVVTNAPVINSISCSNATTASTASATCMAVGYKQATNVPYLIALRNNGTSFTDQSSALTGFTSGIITGVSCTPSTNASNVFCMLVGYDGAGVPKVFINPTANSSATWTARTITGFTTAGTLNSVSCTTTTFGTPDVVCAIGGQDTDGTAVPVLYTYDAVANSWSSNGAVTGGTTATINTLSCTAPTPTSSTAVVCVANERVTTSTAQSNGSWRGAGSGTNITWSRTGSTFGATNVITHVTCTPGVSTSAYCIAAGSTSNNGAGAPILYNSLDSGLTWSTTRLKTPNSGAFFGSSKSQDAVRAHARV